MDCSRRDLLGVGGVVAAGALAGCTTGEPMPWTRVVVSLRDAVAAEPPIGVPCSVDVELQNVGRPEVALRGLAVACYDANRELVGRHELGDFARQAVADDRRTTERVEGTWSSATAYRANWTVAPDVDVDAVPRWITVAVDAVEIGPAEDAGAGAADAGTTSPTVHAGATSSLLPVGRARASRPAPEFAATIRRLARPIGSDGQLRPVDYEAVDVDRFRADGRGVGLDRPLLPEAASAGREP